MNRIVLNSPAKINFGLNIVSKRDDGFHNLETFFYPVFNLYDKLTFEKSKRTIFTSNNQSLKNDSSNLILKALELVEKHTSRKLKVKIYLDKNIPLGAGLGGGSSNAAYTLIGLNKLFDLNLSIDVLNNLALQLGSDVPFFIKSKPSIAYSRGEVLKTTAVIIDFPILIVNPGIHISTKKAFDNIIPKKSIFDYKYFTQTKSINFNLLVNNLTNDFEDYVFKTYPEVEKIKSVMYNEGAIFSLMSGTGSTVYGIFRNTETAQKALEKLPASYFWFINK